LLDVPTLRVAELELVDEPSRLGRVVVLDSGLEVLALRRSLSELPTQPPEEADLSRFHAASVPSGGGARACRRPHLAASYPVGKSVMRAAAPSGS
jgi:hypothetical protein